MTPRRVAPALVAIALLVPATSAPAATTAQRFADVFERAKSAMRAKRPEFRAALTAIEFERCARVFAEISLSDGAALPPGREAERVVLVTTAASYQAVYGPARPVYAQMMADLDAIRTRDPALRTARAQWRKAHGLIHGLVPSERPCAQIEAWFDSGWKASARPKIDTRNVGELIDLIDDRNLGRNVERAVRRLRQLGVSRDDAERITGDTLLDTPYDLFEKALERAIDEALLRQAAGRRGHSA